MSGVFWWMKLRKLRALIIFMPRPMLTEADIDLLETRFTQVFFTKKESEKLKSELINKLDSILKEVLASREEQTIVVHKVSEHGDRIENVEKKLQISAAS